MGSLFGGGDSGGGGTPPAMTQRNELLASINANQNLSDVDRKRLLAKIDSAASDNFNTPNYFANNINSITSDYNAVAKNADDVLAAYKAAVSRRANFQSTNLSFGQAAAVANTGASTSLITSGTTK